MDDDKPPQSREMSIFSEIAGAVILALLATLVICCLASVIWLMFWGDRPWPRRLPLADVPMEDLLHVHALFALAYLGHHPLMQIVQGRP